MSSRWYKQSINLGRKTLVTILGVLIIILSIVISPLPGPGGIPLFLVGLAVLAREYAWARRLMKRFKEVGANIWKLLSRNKADD